MQDQLFFENIATLKANIDLWSVSERVQGDTGYEINGYWWRSGSMVRFPSIIMREMDTGGGVGRWCASLLGP